MLRPGLLDDVLRAVGTTAKTVNVVFGAVFPLLDIALAGYLLLEIIDQTDKHRQEMELVYERIEEEFRQDRLANLVTALKIGRNLSAAKDVAFKRLMVGQVTDRLLEAREHLREDFLELLKGEMSESDAVTAMRYQILSMQAATLIVRAWLEIGEQDLALEWLCGILRGQRERVQLFVASQIRDRRALFFHSSVTDDDFERFLNVERWLRGKRTVLPEIVKENRVDFWNTDAVGDLFTGGLNSQLVEQPFYLASVRNCEVLIENYQRLEGFELVLKSMCFGEFSMWEDFDGENDISIAEHDDYVILVNNTLLGG